MILNKMNTRLLRWGIISLGVVAVFLFTSSCNEQPQSPDVIVNTADEGNDDMVLIPAGAEFFSAIAIWDSGVGGTQTIRVPIGTNAAHKRVVISRIDYTWVAASQFKLKLVEDSTPFVTVAEIPGLTIGRTNASRFYFGLIDGSGNFIGGGLGYEYGTSTGDAYNIELTTDSDNWVIVYGYTYDP
jgi:hypothetical protein